MIDLKPYGVFIEHTIRPLLDEIRHLFRELRDNGVILNVTQLEAILKTACRFHLQHMALHFITKITVTAALCATAIYIVRCTT